MKAALLLLFALCSLPLPAQQSSPVLYQTQFEGRDALTAWQSADTPGASLVPGYNGSQSLLIEQPAATGSRTVSISLPVAKMRDAQIDFRAMIKAENVAVPPQVYNGVKFMLVTNGPSGKQYPSHDHLWGTFDWKMVTFRADVPPDATEATLVLGLEATTGRAWFDNISVTVHARAWAGSPVAPAGEIYTGHPGIPRLRGAMIDPPHLTAADLHVLGGEWNANLVRWQLYWVTPDGRFDGWRDPAAYDAWLEASLQHLDSLLPVCKQQGIHVVVDLHTPPGGNIMLPGYNWPLFQDKTFQDKFLTIWQKLARRYKGNPTVWGYDLANEPLEGDVADGLMDWHTLATKAAQTIRAIDPDHAIIVEPPMGGSPTALKFFPPLPVSGVVYSVHMYEPGTFTMQGVTPAQPVGVTYPGRIDGADWNRAQMAKFLHPVAEYQARYHVQMYIGEFSAIRWAGGAAGWLRDAISIFEQNHWDWSYHAFREWQGWSVEYPSDKDATAPSLTPTDRQLLLRSWYAKNVKPHS